MKSRTRVRTFKYPLSVEVAGKIGRSNGVYAKVYALETWAVRHGYKGYRKHNKRTNAQKALQQRIRF